MIRITSDVFCDRCGDWEHGLTSHKPEVREARRIAKGKNWKRVKNEDLCPACASGKTVSYE